jgi:hypothetical protein
LEIITLPPHFGHLPLFMGQSFYPEIIEFFAQTVSDVLDEFIRTPIETDHDFQRAFSGPFQRLAIESESLGSPKGKLAG